MNSKRIISCLFLLAGIGFSITTQAKITQSIDRKDISAGETFILDIQIDSDTDAQPDLSLIPSDFTIESTSQYQHTQIINGQRSSIKGWKIKLQTLKTGKITLPAITVGSESTRPIELNIKDTSDQLDVEGQLKAIFLEADTDTKEAFVQQEVIYTIRLFRAINTHYPRLSDPTAKDSIIEKLGDDVQFEKIINGQRYIVNQRKFALFPQQSGDMEISPVTFTADINDGTNRRSLFLNSTRPISISTKPVTIKVKPKPASASTPWLPAKKVSLSDQWTPETTELKVGEPFTWTINLTVEGLSESQLPEIKLPMIQGLQLYPDTPQKEREINENGIVGHRVEKFAVIPSVEGEVSIPPVTLKWWDISSNSEKMATLPARKFKVLPGAKAETSPTPTPLPEVLPQNQNAPVNEANLSFWRNLSFGLGALWLLTLIAYLTKRGSISEQTIESLKSTSEQSHSLSGARRSVVSAVKSGEAREIEESLIQLARACGNTQISSLGGVIKLTSEQDLITKLRSLESALYSAKQQTEIQEFSSGDLERLIMEFSTQRNNQGSDTIPPLYPR